MLKHFFLRGTLCFAPGMRVVEGHIHLGVAHDCLNHGGIFLLVHEERRQRMTPEVVEAEPLFNFPVAVLGHAVLDPDDARCYRGGSDIVFDQL